MELKIHQQQDTAVAEVLDPQVIIQTTQDGIDLMGNVYYQGYDRVILHQHQLTPAFFDLSSKIAGEVLQKFSTYRMRLAIVGDFSKLIQESRALKDFIHESNQGRQVYFTDSLEAALSWLSSK